ncbi:MAG: glycosyltransferase family 4 protein [Candidatus Nanoarchaeia archaeon]|nr:glycosyltransferase family 4 protein [Candidatus Nanoarchaeia archaeon]
MKKIFILNSDFGEQIGARASHITKHITKSELIIFTRSFKKNLVYKYNIKLIFPFAKLSMQVLTAMPIYIYKKFPANEIKNKLFEYFLLRKLTKTNFKEIELIHSWNFLPETYKYIKTSNSKIKIIQDVPIALPNILNKIKEFNILFKGESTKTLNFIKNSFKYVDLFIVPSQFVKDSLLLEKIPEKKIKIIPFGVDSNKFKPQKNKSKQFQVAFSGNVNNRKGIKYLIEAWKQLKDKKQLPQSAKLNLYGRVYPETKSYLKNSSKYNIFAHGHIDLIKELPKNSIYVFPSLMEGSAKSVYEAMACGLPIITTYNAGSVIQNGKEGFIIPIQDVNSIKEKILFFYNNRNEIEKFGKQARKTAEKYTWKRYTNTIINEVYK